MADSSIHFTVSFQEPQAHYAEIQIDLQQFDKDYIDLKMPVWTPGSYLIREYSRHVERLSAEANGKAVRCEKIAKNTWRVYSHKENVKVQYSVYGFEVSVRTNFIDNDHAFLSSAATFMFPDGFLNHPSTLSITLPENWSSVSTGLPTVPGKEHTYYASDFDILFDSPLEIGNQDVWHFEAAGVQHEFAMVGGGTYDKKQLSEDIRKIVEIETDIWGENPNSRYVFITHNYQNGGGGLEHLNSTVLGASRNGYQQAATYKNFLSLVAHEYFHLWNVKRLRPKALGPFDYEAENYTTGLWIMEGFTAYYDNLIIRRCNFHSPKEYLNLLALDFNIVYNRPGFQIQSAGLASFDTWIKQYRPDENSSNTSISYYNKGAMLAAALDIRIITETDGAKRLDDVLRAAYQQFYKTEGHGFEESAFQTLAEQTVGVDLSDIFEAAHTNQELDYNDFFEKVGYQLIDVNANNQERSLGLKTAVIEGRIVVKVVERGSAAWDAGISVDDELIAINGTRLDVLGKELDFVLEQGAIDDIVDVLVSRDGLIRTVPTPLRRTTKKVYTIQEFEQASVRAKELGRIWLSI
ncbi:M61 family metallopeptidase [Sphingobacterium psychroaquaticum]|uniref:Predicted metalloprotease, contains C-terminal PDZ domain n=1 Tax=Sphingobacterium psychroaquaticum TaxID=561061 RepID=A0A1X7HZ79_9SPHI|nr:PDZ domain-containing protein [Sphingobacterium psychroaquaticum]SMG07321.1 Predicted metalloprotease, contains C-terminal PDZ domain [Sphingobacterium psychroaquaticum]